MKRMLPVLALLIACADEIPESVSTQMEAARTAHETAADTSADLTELLTVAPPGGYADWIRDISTGLDTVPSLAAADRGEALHVVQELYSRRYDALRDFYGPDGAVDVGEAVSQATAAVGTQLQTLMGLLADSATEIAVVEQSVRTTQQSLLDLDAAAQAAGLPPNAPRL